MLLVETIRPLAVEGITVGGFMLGTVEIGLVGTRGGIGTFDKDRAFPSSLLVETICTSLSLSIKPVFA